MVFFRTQQSRVSHSKSKTDKVVSFIVLVGAALWMAYFLSGPILNVTR